MHGEPEGAAELPSRRPPLVAMLLAAGAVALVVLVHVSGIGQSVPPAVFAPPPIARQVSARTSLPICQQAGISVAGGREGRCVEGAGAGAGEVHVVVDGGHVLRMPRYHAELVGSRLAPTHVTGPYADGVDYPGHHGWVVSLRVRVTNVSARPLVFDAAARDVSLFTPPRTASDGNVFEYRERLAASAAPAGRLGAAGPIAPRHSATGWVSFVTPYWVATLLTAPPAELTFRRADHRPEELGVIRLWKFSSPAARRAAGLR